MSQKKIYVYSPDGEDEGWFMELESPAGWLPSPPGGIQEEPDEPEESEEEELARLQAELNELEEEEDE